MSKIITTIESLKNLHHLQPASKEEIRNAEYDLDVLFADEYKEYLGKYGVISAKGVELTGLCVSERLNVVDVTKSERLLNESFPDGMYVVENICIEGVLILQDHEGKIYEFAPNIEPVLIFDSLSEYLKNK